MPAPTRRQFLAAAAALPAAPAGAVDPVARPAGKPLLKLSLAAYSFRAALGDQRKKAASTMSLFEFVDLAAGLPVDAVELTSYFFADTSDAYLARLRAHATRQGLAVSGVPVGNDFCRRDPAKLRAEVVAVKTWTERAAMLGAPTVRIFAGNLEKGDALEAAQRRVVEAVEECCEHAAKYGVLLALENHGGITAKPADMLAVVRAVKSAAFGVNVDTGNFKTADPYADLGLILPYAVNVQVKTEVFPDGGPAREADLGRVVGLLKAANYRGYVALEYEAKGDPTAEVPKYLAELRKLIS